MERPYDELDWKNWKVGQKVVCRKTCNFNRLKIDEEYRIRNITNKKEGVYQDNSNTAPLVFLEGKKLGYFIWRFKRAPKIIDEGEDE